MARVIAERATVIVLRIRAGPAFDEVGVAARQIAEGDRGRKKRGRKGGLSFV